MNLSLNNFKKIFTHSWCESILMLLLTFGLIKLGFWQLHRAQEKRLILMQFQKQQKQSPIEWDPTHQTPEPYQKIIVHGNLLEKRIFLDNQFYHHRIGYHVIVPVRIDNKVLLVDAGWVEAPKQREEWPFVNIKKQKIWEGTVYIPLHSKVTYLGQLIDHQQGNNMVIESLDTKNIAQLLQLDILPWILRLNKDNSQSLIREWPLIALSPQKHLAYAAQWFLMALIAISILLWRKIK